MALENLPQSTKISETEPNSNASSGLIKQMANLTRENSFHISFALFYFLQALDNRSKQRKFGYIVGVVSTIHFSAKNKIGKLKRISKHLSNHEDDLTHAESPLQVDKAFSWLELRKKLTLTVSFKTTTLLPTKVPTIRYVPINVQYKW